jgi:hypothetical protein
MPTAIKIFSETELRAPQSISALPIHQRSQMYRTIYQFSSNLPRGVRTASLSDMGCPDRRLELAPLAVEANLRLFRVPSAGPRPGRERTAPRGGCARWRCRRNRGGSRGLYRYAGRGSRTGSRRGRCYRHARCLDHRRRSRRLHGHRREQRPAGSDSDRNCGKATDNQARVRLEHRSCLS